MSDTMYPAHLAQAPELDATCRSRNHYHKGAYQMFASCQVCSTFVVLTISRGHEPPNSFGGGPECPVCGNRRWGRFVLKGKVNAATAEHAE